MLAVRPKITARGRSTAVTIPAPTLGWNARDALANMGPQDAVTLTNMFPSPTAVTFRNGYTQYATFVGQAETLMQYAGAASEKLFAAADDSVIEVTAGGVASNYVNLPGTASDYVSTPDSAALDITGSIEIIMRVALADWTPASDQRLLAKFTTTGNQRSYRLSCITGGGFLNFQTSVDGTAVNNAPSTAAVGATDGAPIWIRVTRNSVTGDVNYYTAADQTDIPTTWTQLGATVSTTAAAIFAGTAVLTIGAQIDGTAAPTTGKVYAAYIYNGIGGTLAASMVPNDTIVADTSWASVLTGETWTTHGAAAVAGGKQLLGLTNSRFQYVNNTTSGGNYIQAVNGADKMIVFDGTSWHQDGSGSPYDVTGVDTADCIGITLSHNRVWLIQNASLKAWYLPAGAIGGAANALDLSSFADRGGYLMAAAAWTMDAGYGMDDMLAFITSEGQVIVYRGTDPSSVATWALVGVYWIGSPIGRRCAIKFGGDCLLITQDGVVSMAAALQSSRVNPKAALSNKIQYAISLAISSYGSNFGWQLMQFPRENMLILNVPFQEGSTQQQFVMSTIQRANKDWAWCNFTGWEANCWELWQDNIYFGGDGFVGKAWNGNSDNGDNINCNGLQAFNNFSNDKIQKRFTMMRPIIQSNGSPAILAQMNVDFDLSDPSAPLSFTGTSYGVWDVGVWDSALWGGGFSLLKDWQGCVGIGYWGAPHLVAATMGIDSQWINTTVVWEPGFIL